LPVRFVRLVAADKVVVSLQPGGPEHVVELDGCRAIGGLAARQAAELALGDAVQLHLALPLVNADRLVAQYPRPLVGHVFLDSDQTLAQYLVRTKLAEWQNAE
jgi:hypothetical protein